MEKTGKRAQAGGLPTHIVLTSVWDVYRLQPVSNILFLQVRGVIIWTRPAESEQELKSNYLYTCQRIIMA